jgi:hypothetical protein
VSVERSLSKSHALLIPCTIKKGHLESHEPRSPEATGKAISVHSPASLSRKRCGLEVRNMGNSQLRDLGDNVLYPLSGLARLQSLSGPLVASPTTNDTVVRSTDIAVSDESGHRLCALSGIHYLMWRWSDSVDMVTTVGNSATRKR